MPTAWECVREVDRALLRDAPDEALAWVGRCRAHDDGPQGMQLGAREVTALCATGRVAEANAVAVHLVARDAYEARRRLARTCVRDVMGGAR